MSESPNKIDGNERGKFVVFPNPPSLPNVTPKDDNKENGNGGGGNMKKDDYVTHEELDHAVDKLSDKMDLMEERLNTKFETINTKFAEQENKQIKWFIGTAIAIIGLTVSLIKFF